MSVEALMRSKNLLPVQVIPTVPSSLMGNSQSGQKAAFEEALHSSIENSLRSVAVAPSSVFSTLFLTLRPVPAVHKDDVTDVKPNSEQLAEELNKQTVNRQDVSSDMQNNLLLSKFSFVNRTSVENIVSSPHSTSESGLVQPTVCQPPALIPASHVRHKASSTTLPPVPRPPITLISQQQQQQQQQLEQARVEQLKQMQRLHAWKHMQKDQPRPLLSGLDISASNILPANLSTSLAGSSMSTESSLPVSMPTNPINGMYSNGNFHGVRATGNTQLKGLCKSGKDIRLCTLENDCSQMFTCPSEHVLLALQLTRTTVESNSLIVISINLKSLPPPNSSSQALSIQCVGCGEKAIHTFAQLVDHVGLERSDLGSHPVNSNSGQLIGSYARFYLVRDRKNPRHLIRGPALMWNKQMEAGRLRVGVPVPRFSMMQNPLFRNPGPILPSPSHFSTPREGGNSHHPLVHSLSGPNPSRGIYPMKRKSSSISQETSIEILDEDHPRRYNLNRDNLSTSDVVIPQDLSVVLKRKPVIILFLPLNNPPRFCGDMESVVVTSKFAQCLAVLLEKEPAPFSNVNNLMLLVTIQHIVSLGRNGVLTIEDYSRSVLQARQRTDHYPQLNELSTKTIIALATLSAASSGGCVEFVLSKVSISDAISQYLVSAKSSAALYYVVAWVSDIPGDTIYFHVIINGTKQCRVVAESLVSASEHSLLINKGLVSPHFTQLRLLLSEATNACIESTPTSLDMSYVAQDLNWSVPKCEVLDQHHKEVASMLLQKVHSIYGGVKGCDLSQFTSLRFIFLLPPSPIACKTAIRQIAESGVLSLLFKTSLPVTSLSSQVVIPAEPSSQQRVLSICKQWTGSTTLLVLVDLDSNSSEQSTSVINHPCILDSANILVIQCSIAPYALLTNQSKVPSSNQVFYPAPPETPNIPKAVSYTSLFFGTNLSCNSSLSSITFDLDYENLKDHLMQSHLTLRSSLVACELLIQHYISALLITSAEEKEKNRLRQDLKDVYSPLTERIVEGMIGGSKQQNGAIVLIRISSNLIATRFYDAIKQARDRLGQESSFEIVLFDARCQRIEVSDYFLRILRILRKAVAEWEPVSLSDLTGIPCVIIYVGELVPHQELPWTLKYVDLRMAFEGTGLLHRSKLDMEMALAASVCHPTLAQATSSKARNDDDDSFLQVIESDDSQSETVKLDGNLDFTVGESSPNNLSSKEICSSKRPRLESDFISLAMLEAKLPSSDADGRGHKCNPVAPKVILPKRIYDILKSHEEGTTAMTSLPAAPLTGWCELMHSSLDPRTIDPVKVADYYRKYTKPLPGNPDYNDSSDVLDENENQVDSLHDRRLLFVSAPNFNPVQICCIFLKQLHRSLMRMLEIEVYDDMEEILLVPHDRTFQTLLGNPMSRGRSQLTNSCYDLEKLQISNGSSIRKVVTRSSNSSHATSVKRRKENNNSDSTESSLTTCYEVKVIPPSSANYNSTLKLRLIIPVTSRRHFDFIKSEDGSSEIRSLRFKHQREGGLKTTVISLGISGPEEGLYNLSSTLGSIEEQPLHVVVVKECDETLYRGWLPDHVLVVLPQDFDVLGRGAMKFAAQILFTHFYDVAGGNDDVDESVWPFVLFLDDDCVSWSSWKPHDKRSPRIGDKDWVDVPLSEVLEIFESTAEVDTAAVGFRAWSSNMAEPKTTDDSAITLHDNVVSSACIENCVLLNLGVARDVLYSHTWFSCEDLDWSLRLASSGLPLQRFENIAISTKVMPVVKSQEIPDARESVLVTAADSEFVPFPFHPGLLLEKHFSKNAAAVFPQAKSSMSNPVLCVDCYLSLGTDILVEFTSSHPHAPDWSLDYSKMFGGLLLYCPSSNVTHDFLRNYRFVEGATVCVIGNDRSSLRQSVVKLNLETEWHFRLTDEFLTTNQTALSGSTIRPLYFLTGMRKSP